MNTHLTWRIAETKCEPFCKNNIDQINIVELKIDVSFYRIPLILVYIHAL